MRQLINQLFFLLLIIMCFTKLSICKSPTIKEQAGYKFSEAIEDNSYFIEEAYNQESRVVQNISNLLYRPSPVKELTYTFTQEWPMWGINNQFSYTLGSASLDNGMSTGLIDIYLNYRYQLTYKDSWLACSPRFSLIIPVGDKEKNLGSGSLGFQICIPFSKRWSNLFITHFNIGTTYISNTEDKSLGFNNSTISYFGGFSGIFLLSSNFNIMFEYLMNLNSEPNLNNKTKYITQHTISPGIRYAFDFGDLQIVPGIAFPIFISNDSKNTYGGGFFYLSFEHPF